MCPVAAALSRNWSWARAMSSNRAIRSRTSGEASGGTAIREGAVGFVMESSFTLACAAMTCPVQGRHEPRIGPADAGPSPGGILLVVGPGGAKAPGQVQAERPGGVAEAKPPPWGAWGWDKPLLLGEARGDGRPPLPKPCGIAAHGLQSTVNRAAALTLPEYHRLIDERLT